VRNVVLIQFYISVFPNLNSDHEEITFNEGSSSSEVSHLLDIKTSISKDGVEMIGYDSVENYLRILHSLVYINRKPAYYLNRVFKLSCSQLGDRFHSSDFTLTLTVLHPKQQTSTENSVSSEKVLVSIHEHDNSNLFNRILLHPQEVSETHPRIFNNHIGSTTHSTMLILVICVSFVMLICGVGIARLRNQKQNSKGKKNQIACPKVRSCIKRIKFLNNLFDI
jgi:calsyntenin 1